MCTECKRKKRESQSFLSARAKTRSFSLGPRRRPPGGNGSHPRRALRPLRLPRGAQVCTRRGCSGANKKRRERQSFLSARRKPRSFSLGPRRRPPGGNGSHPRRALRPLGLPRGAQVCTRRGCSGANKKRRERQSFLSARAKTRSFSPGPRRRPPGGNGSHPRRALRPLGLPPGARVCTRRGCSRANKKRRESQSFLSLHRVRSNYLTRLRVT